MRDIVSELLEMFQKRIYKQRAGTGKHWLYDRRGAYKMRDIVSELLEMFQKRIYKQQLSKISFQKTFLTGRDIIDEGQKNEGSHLRPLPGNLVGADYFQIGRAHV